jgi:putative ABC transport system permease protein
MKFFKLVVRNLLRSKARTLLTMFGVSVSIFIFAALLSLDRGVQRMIDQTGNDSVLTVFDRYKACPPNSKLPLHYGDKIAALPTVAEVLPVRFLLSTCRTTTDLVAVHGIEADKLRDFKELAIGSADYDAFAAEKGAAIVGREVAGKYGWTTGQQVTLAQLGGVSFVVRGIFDAPGSSSNQVVYVDRTYLEQATQQPGWVTMFLVKPKDPSQADAVAASIDALFANFEVQTKTGPEKAFIARMITDFKDMVRFAQIVAWAALVLLLAAVANSMSMSVRDRLREMAIMKLLGFDSESTARLVLVEAVVASALAALCGAGLAWLAIGRSGFVISVEGFSIVPYLSGEVVTAGLCAGILLGAVGAFLPASGGARLPIVQALKEVD